MDDRIKIVNLDYLHVKKLYDLYMRAKKANKSVLAEQFKKTIYEMQKISRMGMEISFPGVLKPLFEKRCKKFDDDIYIVDSKLLQQIINELAAAVANNGKRIKK